MNIRATGFLSNTVIFKISYNMADEKKVWSGELMQVPLLINRGKPA
jgi:hypothetical protein